MFWTLTKLNCCVKQMIYSYLDEAIICIFFLFPISAASSCSTVFHSAAPGTSTHKKARFVNKSYIIYSIFYDLICTFNLLVCTSNQFEQFLKMTISQDVQQLSSQRKRKAGGPSQSFAQDKQKKRINIKDVDLSCKHAAT